MVVSEETNRNTIRLKCTIAYDGTPFLGWQSQKGGNTVQDFLQKAFQKICARRVAVHGSGRTDAGVHALRQCAHADVERGRLPLAKWPTALNAQLPQEIRVLHCARVADGFHARYSAKAKLYTYRIWNAPVRSPFEINRAWHLPMKLDLAALRAAADLLTGTHDFAAFAANRGSPPATTVRTIHRVTIRKTGSLITIAWHGDGFLYKMARLLTGSIVRCAQGRAEIEWIHSLMANEMKTSFAAPAEGLYLARVFY